MANNIMIDSSLLVEFIKGNKKQLLIELLFNSESECFINETVVSEFLFYFIAIGGGRSPRATQSAEEINTIFARSREYRLIERFSFLPSNANLSVEVPMLMAKYNLLPSDAIILATCKIHGITRLASHDSDFIIPCQEEGITLLSE
jgi:predicted nucleic acid-binding protein